MTAEERDALIERAKCVHGYSWFRCQECPMACGHPVGQRLPGPDATCAQCEYEASWHKFLGPIDAAAMKAVLPIRVEAR